MDYTSVCALISSQSQRHTSLYILSVVLLYQLKLAKFFWFKLKFLLFTTHLDFPFWAH